MLAASATAVPVPVARAQASPPLVLTTLHDFAGDDDGSTPHAGLVQGADGSFYGTTDDENFDGSYGTVFKITANGKLTTLHAFSGGDDNGNPTSALIQGADGNFYGTTDAGSGETNNNECTDFRITPAGALTTLHAFPGTEGFEPSALVQATDGNFYGALRGSIYRLTPGGGHAFVHGVADGPTGGLIQGRDGILYCTAYSSSSATGDHGSLFRLTLRGDFTNFHTFHGTDGSAPVAALTEGRDGNFYGTASLGGIHGKGTIFQITPAGKLTTLYHFTGGADGAGPTDKLVESGDGGRFYGTTREGGKAGYGTVFEVTAGKAFTLLYTFGGDDDGGYPNGLIEAMDGNLYGTTRLGGKIGGGTVFRLEIPYGTIRFTAAAYPVNESGKSVTLQVARTSGSVGAATVHFATADGTALAGRDYTAKHGILSWADGDASTKKIVVGLLDPGVVYPDAKRRFVVKLSAPATHAHLGTPGTATVVITGTTRPTTAP